ncbi:MAG: ATP-binding cassette domain-containing protein [Ilumatobacteraceae bacterium]|nr:ATP-binding cassette domain-containing protein [Ilumatobacteraceae bacterium]
MTETVADLVIENLTVEFTKGDYTVRPLDDFSCTVPAGSLALLLGPSGCGKTTLLSCLGGILKPTAGKISYAGTDVTTLAGKALTNYRQRGVGVVFQAFNLVPSLTAVENVSVPMRSAGVARREARDKAVGLLESVGLGDRLTHRPNSLSGGQQQRVAIARALALDPLLVLADEPTAHLDYVQVEGILRIIRGLTDGGRAVVVATHDERLLALADQIIEMRPHFVPDDATSRTVNLAAGSLLFEQGDPSDVIYVVDSGELEVLRESPEGRVLLSIISAGDYVGEMGPLFGLDRAATVRARMASTLTGYSVKAFRNLVGDDKIPSLIRGHR